MKYFTEFLIVIPIKTIVHTHRQPNWVMRCYSNTKYDSIYLLWGSILSTDKNYLDLIWGGETGQMETLVNWSEYVDK